MKVSLNWAQQTSNVNLLKLSREELLNKIGAQLGAIEEVSEWGGRFDKARVVKVVSSVKHPNADKLHVCTIDDGKTVKGLYRNGSGHVQVVCGAPNVKAGMHAVWLPPGATVPSTVDKDPLVLESRNIRGEISNGMLASSAELGLSDDHSGIVEVEINQLAAGTKPGTPLNKALRLDNDLVIDIENKMFTHRPDCFGILGVARELAGITNQAFESPSWYKTPSKLTKEGQSLLLTIKNTLTKLVPRFTAVVVRVGTNGPSPLWLQADLSRVGLRPINTVVDVTNYIMYLTGQPLHAYDYDKLAVLHNKPVSLETRLSKKGEKLTLLGDKEITFNDQETVLITSHNTPVGIGGIMGGKATEVDENTKTIVLECANFDMYNIRKSAMRYGLFTDAVTRFTKGQSSLQQDRVIAQAAQYVVKLTQGSIASNLLDKHGTLNQPRAVRVTPEFINKRLGLQLSPKKISELLENVEFKVRAVAAKQLAVIPPFWRTDIHIPEDVVEEVGRLYGYDHLPLQLPNRDLTPTLKDDSLSFKQKLRDVLSKSGANEVLTYSFVHGDLLKKVGQDPKHAFQLNNAISPDLQYYRLSLTPSLLGLVHTNIKAGHYEFALFEINKVHYKGEWDEAEPKVPNEDEHLACVISFNDKSRPAGAAYYQARNYIRLVISDQAGSLLPLTDFDMKTDEWGKNLAAPFEPTRSAAIIKDGQIWGVVGEFRTTVARALKLPSYSAGFEVNLGVVSNYEKIYKPLSRFPRIEQDVTLKVPIKHGYGEIYKLLQEKLEELKPENSLANLTPIDIYQKQDSHKNMTWRLSIASYERTLTDQEVNKLLDEITEAAKTAFDAGRL